ncbi:MAG: hypothetical protein IBJ16_03745 [Chitinophagaceae bacterium]|nr:hypothetical protein [Chitinophagaceae bacterium]
MTVPERLYAFMHFKQLKARTVELECGLSNGYLGKQRKNKGSFGGNILRKIEQRFPELNMTWLLSGDGEMLNAKYREVNTVLFDTVEEESAIYGSVQQEIISLLRKQIEQMESALSDKQKLILILEKQLEAIDT